MVFVQPLAQHVADRVDDLKEARLAGVESGDELLVDRVVDSRCATARGPGAPGEIDGRERAGIEGFERPGLRGAPVDRTRRVRDSVWPTQGERDGQSHVRRR